MIAPEVIIFTDNTLTEEEIPTGPLAGNAPTGPLAKIPQQEDDDTVPGDVSE